MPPRKPSTWYENELYELLCLLMTGACFWLLGKQLHLFGDLSKLAARFGLTDLIVLGFCMSFGLYAAALRKSHKLHAAVAARDLAQAEAESVARHDTMTGLANRRFFIELLTARLSDAARAKSTALLLIDLDRFKAINDLHGHAAGDAVLCGVAERLRARLPPGSLVARLGGDEFAVMADFGVEVDAVARLCQAIVTELSQPILWNGTPLRIGVTVGVGLTAADAMDAEALLHAANVAMYEGKKDGRGTIRFFRKEMDQSLKARAVLERELRVAIDSGQIQPFFQPLVSLVDQALIGFEVLARWRHPVRGLLTPDHFIAVAEDTGMIGDLCWSVLRQACHDARSWPQHLQLAINISPQQLQDPNFPDAILCILAETGFPPYRLEVEITETALIADLNAARSALRALRSLGIRIALDDFGTGYSSLYHLRELQFDKLKIDRSYVESLSQGDEREKLVDAIIALGTSLGMVTTAEGIEVPASLDWLAARGCTYGQGYLFGKPMPKEAADQWISSHSAGQAQLQAKTMAA